MFWHVLKSASKFSLAEAQRYNLGIFAVEWHIPTKNLPEHDSHNVSITNQLHPLLSLPAILASQLRAYLGHNTRCYQNMATISVKGCQTATKHSHV